MMAAVTLGPRPIDFSVPLRIDADTPRRRWCEPCGVWHLYCPRCDQVLCAHTFVRLFPELVSNVADVTREALP